MDRSTSGGSASSLSGVPAERPRNPLAAPGVALARVEVAFAAAGLVLAAGVATLRSSGRSVVAYTVAGAFLSLCLYAGRELSRGTRRGLTLSLLVQALQVVHVNMRSFGVLFLAGPWLEVGMSRSLVGVTLGGGAVAWLVPVMPRAADLAGTVLYAQWGLLLAESPEPSVRFGINLVALVFAVRLWRLLRARDKTQLGR